MQRVEYAAARLAVALLRALGPVAASDWGGRIARWIGPLLPVSRIANVNLRLTMPELDAPARAAIIRGVWDNLGRTVAELPHLGALAEDVAAGPGWSLDGAPAFAALAAQGGPAILFSGHIGNWEMLSVAAARHGLAFGGFYRAADNPAVDALLAGLRRDATGVETKLFPKGAAGARLALKHLSSGGFLGMLVDQKMNDGIEARLFGRPAMTPSALAALALRLRCPVMPAHVERLGPARFRIVCEDPLPLPDTGDRAADMLVVTQMVNDRLEAWVRARPESWLWLHRRFDKALYRNG
jgi:KDO2-lipid IV(A) lauroyltransferase